MTLGETFIRVTIIFIIGLLFWIVMPTLIKKKPFSECLPVLAIMSFVYLAAWGDYILFERNAVLGLIGFAVIGYIGFNIMRN